MADERPGSGGALGRADDGIVRELGTEVGCGGAVGLGGAWNGECVSNCLEMVEFGCQMDSHTIRMHPTTARVMLMKINVIPLSPVNVAAAAIGITVNKASNMLRVRALMPTMFSKRKSSTHMMITHPGAAAKAMGLYLVQSFHAPTVNGNKATMPLVIATVLQSKKSGAYQPKGVAVKAV